MAIQLGAVVSITQAHQLLQQITTKIVYLEPGFRRYVAPLVSEDLRQQYLTRGAHLGTPWKPLAVSTIRGRTRQTKARGKTRGRATTTKQGRGKWGFSYPMVDTTRSYKSLVNLTDPEGIRSFSATSMRWGSRLGYLAPHHDPTNVRGIPTRYVIPPTEKIPPAVIERWTTALVDYITDVAQGHLP